MLRFCNSARGLPAPRPVLLAFLPCMLFVAVLATSWPLARPALAFDGRAGDDVVIASGQVVDDDLYLAGGTVTIDGRVRGDVVVAARILTINGSIEGGLIAAAQTVVLNGNVRDTARVAAQAFQMAGGGSVGRDLVLVGYSAEIRSGSSVGRDFGGALSQALIDGRIERNIRGGFDALQISGQIGGDVFVSVGGGAQSASTAAFGGSNPPGVTVPIVPRGLAVTDAARIDGRLRYEATQEYPIAGRVGQGVSFNQRTTEAAPQRGPVDVVLDIGRKIVAIAVVGLLLMWLAPGGLVLIGDTIQARPAASVGWGLVVGTVAVLAIIGVAFGIVIFILGFGVLTLFSLAGLIFMLGLLSEVTLVVGLVVFSGLVAQAIVSYRAGRMLLDRIRPQNDERGVIPLLVGALLLAILTEIPFLGGLLALAVGCAALGAAWLLARGARSDRLITAPRDAGPVRAPAPAE